MQLFRQLFGLWITLEGLLHLIYDTMRPKLFRVRSSIESTLQILNLCQSIWQIKILGVVLKLPARLQCQSSPFYLKKGPNGLKLEVLFSLLLQNGPNDFDCFNCHGCQTFFLADIHCYLSALKSWHDKLFLSGVL